MRTIWALSLSALVGILAGAAMMYVAWQHNPECEIHCQDLGIAWGYWLTIGASWAIPVAIVFGLALCVIGAVPALCRTLFSKRTR